MSDSAMKRSLSPESEGSSSRKERNTLLVSLLDIDYDDRGMDNEVFTNIRDYFPFIDISSPDLNPQYCLHVLREIILSSPALDKSFTTSAAKLKTFFEDHKERLISLLVEGWNCRSFTEIRKIKELQSVKEKQPAKETVQPQDRHARTTTIDNQVVLNAWEERYEGTNHTLLYESINEMKRRAAYSTTVAIVQSSGTGKSRMVDEQANLVFTLPFCLRPPKDAKSFAYPPTDQGIYDYFTKVTDLRLFAIKCQYLRFLACLFDCTRKELEANFQTQQSYTRLARAWRTYLIPRRQNFYASVLQFAKEEKTVDLKTEMNNANLQLELLLKHIDNLSSVRCDPNKVKLMLYFDEAHTLTGDQPILVDEANDRTMNLYDGLCSSLADLYKQPLFTIFLSTNSNLSQLARAGRLASSARASQNPGVLQAPITETAFDCSPNLLVKSGELTLEDVCSIEFMAQFGRPLFWSLLEAGKKQANNMADEILRLARSKLICDERLDTDYSALGKTAKMALLDCRIMLDYAPRHEKALEHEIEMVASHMRLAYSVPQSREYIRSGYSSEPLLAEAAAQQLALYRRMRSSVELDILCEIVSTDKMIDVGMRGEMLGRNLLQLAHDHGVETEYRKEYPSDSDFSGILYSRGCGVIHFVEELFRSKHATVVLDSLPDNVKSSKKFRTAFKNARVRFTHFVKLADDSGVTTEGMFAAFVRGMAFVGHNTQALMDYIIPVLLEIGPLGEWVMTSIFVSIKRHLRAGSKNAYEIKAEKLNFFPELKLNQDPFSDDKPEPELRPYISLIMELGVQNRISLGSRLPTKVERNLTALGEKLKERSAKQSAPNVQFTTPSKLDVGKKGTLEMELRSDKKAKKKHPRYSVYAYGCSDTVYRVIEKDQRDRYALLLQTKDLLGEHPRGEKAREAVRRMKPYWSVGVSSYHWIVNDFLQGGKAIDAVEERIEVGAIGDDSDDLDAPE